MLKKIMFTLLTLILIMSGAVILYRIFEPETQSTVTSAKLDYDSLYEYLTSSSEGSAHYLLFVSEESIDSQYVLDSLLSSVQSDTGTQIGRIIEAVDITELERSMRTYKLKEDWGLTYYPSFLAVEIQDGVPVVQSSLEWNPDAPLSVEQVEEWLEDNGLITQKNERVDVQELTLETPTPSPTAQASAVPTAAAETAQAEQ